MEAEARRLQAVVIRLDTSAHLEEAVSLYERSGYRRIDPYNNKTYATGSRSALTAGYSRDGTSMATKPPLP